MEIHARNLLNAYPRLLDCVLYQGRTSAPRGKPVTEATEPVVWHLHNPWEWSLPIPGRRINPHFALAEVVWMWSGKGGADFIVYYNKQIAQFLDQGIPYFNAAYGKRVRHAGYSELPFRQTPFPRTNGQIPEPVEVDQLNFVINKILSDPDTRQAVVSLWDPIKDNFVTSNDHPCNNMVYFSNRDGKLNVTVVIRSNDLIWGTPYNMIQFVHLQALIAGTLDLEIGSFTVMCNNLHIYTNLYPEILAKVKKWRSSEGATELASYTYADVPDMRWHLRLFDAFVLNAWEPLEKELRDTHEKFMSYPSTKPRQHGAALNVLYHRMTQMFEEHMMPEYWRQLFLVMFMHHVRKAKQTDMFNEMAEGLQEQMYWLVDDFNAVQE